MGGVLRRVPAVVIALGVFGGIAPASTAASPWFEQPVIATAEPPIVTAPSGAALATWTVRDSGIKLVAALRSRGGSWSTPIEIARSEPRAAAVPVPFSGRFDRGGVASVLWGWARDRSTANSGDRPADPLDVDPARLQLTTLAPEGPRSTPVLGEVAASTRLLAPPELVVLADGTSIVSAIVEPVSSPSSAATPDVLVAAVDRPGQAPTATVLERGTAGYSALSSVDDVGGGATLAVSGWRVPVTGYATTISGFRWTAESGWRRSSATAPEPLGPFTMAAHAGDPDATYLVGGSASGLVYGRLGRGDEWLATPRSGSRPRRAPAVSAARSVVGVACRPRRSGATVRAARSSPSACPRSASVLGLHPHRSGSRRSGPTPRPCPASGGSTRSIRTLTSRT